MPLSLATQKPTEGPLPDLRTKTRTPLERETRAKAVSISRLIEKLAQLQGVDRRGAFLIIIEIDEHVAALFFP